MPVDIRFRSAITVLYKQWPDGRFNDAHRDAVNKFLHRPSAARGQRESGQKKPRPCRAQHVPLNMFYNMWNPPGRFRLPVKACRPRLRLRLLDRSITVQGLVANHEQGRVNLRPLPKNISSKSGLLSLQTEIFSSKFFENFPVGQIAGGGRYISWRLFRSGMTCKPWGS